MPSVLYLFELFLRRWSTMPSCSSITAEMSSSLSGFKLPMNSISVSLESQNSASMSCPLLSSWSSGVASVGFSEDSIAVSVIVGAPAGPVVTSDPPARPGSPELLEAPPGAVVSRVLVLALVVGMFFRSSKAWSTRPS